MMTIVVGEWTQQVDGLPFVALIAIIMCGTIPAIGHTSVLRALPWIALQVAWSIVALLLWRDYQNHQMKRSLAYWRRRLMGLWILHGLAWGLEVPTFWQPGNPTNQAVLSILILGTMVGSFYSLAAMRGVFAANLGALIVPSWICFLLDGGAMALVQSIMFPLFAGLMMSYGWQLSSRFRRAVELRFENQDLIQALTRAKYVAEEANRAKSQFLANMSHELRTPLNAVIGFSEIIRDRTFGEKAMDKYSDYAGDVVSSARHLLNLINQILDLAKLEAGKMDLEPQAFRFSDVLAQCVRAVAIKAKEKQLALIVDDRTDGRLVCADETAIRQIVLNLTSNALKFTDQGHIKITALTSGNWLALEVEDSGRGIAQDELERIFSPFERIDNTLSAAQGGTGLGLAILKQLVTAHGGECSVTSDKGRGATFYVRLPIVAESEAVEAA